LCTGPRSAKGLYARLEEKAARDYTIPGSSRTRVAEETIRDWLKAYRQGGFDALLPKPRADRGQVRKLPAAVAEALLATKEGNPALSVQLVIREARNCPRCPRAAAAALHRAPAAGPPWADGQARRRGR
jgi:putative transposase